jgi:hypothetical protein
LLFYLSKGQATLHKGGYLVEAPHFLGRKKGPSFYVLAYNLSSVLTGVQGLLAYAVTGF